MKFLLAAGVIAALAIAYLAIRSEGGGSAPERSALTSDAHTTELADVGVVEASPTETAPRVARAAEQTAASDAAPASVSDSAPAPARITATLTVRVVDEDGAGVHRANVMLQPTPEEIPALRTGRGNGYTMVQGSTDRDGRVMLEVSAGRKLELRALRFGETSEGTVLVDALEVGERAEATIVVKTRNDLVLEGRVVDAESGVGLAGIELRLEQQSGSPLSREQRPHPLPPASEPDAVTDGAGRFRVPAKSWTTTGALFTGAGWSTRIAQLHQADAPRPANAAARVEPTEPAVVEIALLRAARIEGTVTGAPLPALVKVAIPGHGLISERPWPDWSHLYGTGFLLTTTVDAAGVFTLEDVPAEAGLALSLVAIATGGLLLQEAQPVLIAAGATRHVSWALGSGGRFECSVHHAAGAPAPNEELWLLALGPAEPGETEAEWEPLQRARTDASGRASFEDVQRGPWVVALAPASEHSGASTLRYAVLATIDTPGASVPVAFTLHTGLYIAGTVVTPGGKSAQATVYARSAAFRAQARDAGRRDGRFRIGPLLPGRYVLFARRSGPTSEGATPLTDSDLTSAEAGAAGVELRLKAGCDFVLSAINAATGDAAPAAFTVIPQERETFISTGGYHASATIGGQAPGRYRVLARSEEGLVGEVAVDVAAGERRAVTVPVAAGGRVRIEYSGPARVLTAVLEVPDAKVGLALVPTGHSETLHAPAGSYTLRMAVREFDHATQQMNTLREETRAVEITAGGEVVIEVVH